jgi:hypothetical protein
MHGVAKKLVKDVVYLWMWKLEKINKQVPLSKGHMTIFGFQYIVGIKLSTETFPLILLKKILPCIALNP